VINTFLRRDLHLLNDEMSPCFRDVYDHVLRATEWTESLRDLISSILDTNLAIQANGLNVTTKKVTGWAAAIGRSCKPDSGRTRKQIGLEYWRERAGPATQNRPHREFTKEDSNEPTLPRRFMY
jgi:hypothetical protein